MKHGEKEETSIEQRMAKAVKALKVEDHMNEIYSSMYSIPQETRRERDRAIMEADLYRMEALAHDSGHSFKEAFEVGKAKAYYELEASQRELSPFDILKERQFIRAHLEEIDFFVDEFQERGVSLAESVTKAIAEAYAIAREKDTPSEKDER